MRVTNLSNKYAASCGPAAASGWYCTEKLVSTPSASPLGPQLDTAGGFTFGKSSPTGPRGGGYEGVNDSGSFDGPQMPTVAGLNSTGA